MAVENRPVNSGASAQAHGVERRQALDQVIDFLQGAQKWGVGRTAKAGAVAGGTLGMFAGFIPGAIFAGGLWAIIGGGAGVIIPPLARTLESFIVQMRGSNQEATAAQTASSKPWGVESPHHDTYYHPSSGPDVYRDDPLPRIIDVTPSRREPLRLSNGAIPLPPAPEIYPGDGNGDPPSTPES